MDIRDEAASLDAEGHARTTLDALNCHETFASHDCGHRTLVHRGVIGRASFRSRQTEIRLGLSKNPVVAPDGSIVFETAFPRDQIVPPHVSRLETAEQARTAVEVALALSCIPRVKDAVRLLEAAAALVLGAASAVSWNFAHQQTGHALEPRNQQRSPPFPCPGRRQAKPTRPPRARRNLRDLGS